MDLDFEAFLEALKNRSKDKGPIVQEHDEQQTDQLIIFLGHIFF